MEPRPFAGGDSQPASYVPTLSAMIDVDVHCARNDTVGVPKSELRAEHVQQDQHHDDQKHHGEDSSASAAAGLNDGRALAVGIVAIIGHWKLSLSNPVVAAKRTNFGDAGSAKGKVDEN
jgi:hypothetical protein